jgi:hypothetical protein
MQKKPEPRKTLLSEGCTERKLGNELYEPKVKLYFAQQKELKDGDAKEQK